MQWALMDAEAEFSAALLGKIEKYVLENRGRADRGSRLFWVWF